MQREVPPPERLVTGSITGTVDVLGNNGHVPLVADECDHNFKRGSIVEANMNTIWDVRRFATPTTPVVIGRIPIPVDLIEGPHWHIADMPIKFPRTGFQLPSELSNLRATLASCVSVERAINPLLDDYYAYLTLQRSRVEAGEAPRGQGAHSDSVQGPRINPKRVIEHGYLATSVAPPQFYCHGFDLTDFNPDYDYFGVAFNSQKDERIIFQARPFEIVLFDAYCIHSAVPVSEPSFRTFFRLTFSTRKFDRQGNTHNALFNYDWEMVPRPIPIQLRGFHPLGC